MSSQKGQFSSALTYDSEGERDAHGGVPTMRMSSALPKSHLVLQPANRMVCHTRGSAGWHMAGNAVWCE